MTLVAGSSDGTQIRRVLGDVDEVLTTTRSVRKRLDLSRPVPRAVLEECLRLATFAPNADDRQSWRWLVLTDQRSKDILAEYYRLGWVEHTRAGAGKRRSRYIDPRPRERNHRSAAWLVDNLHRVPALVLPCVVGRPIDPEEIRAAEQRSGFGVDGPSPRMTFGLLSNAIYYGSIFPAIWSFQLALRSRGLGSTITTMHLPFAEFVGDELGIPRHVTQIALLPVGYTQGLDFAPARRRPVEQVCLFDGWEKPRVTDDRHRQRLTELVRRGRGDRA